MLVLKQRDKLQKNIKKQPFKGFLNEELTIFHPLNKLSKMLATCLLYSCAV